MWDADKRESEEEMMKTIEERLDAHAIACQSVAVDLIYRHPDDDVYSDIDIRDAIEAAIIAGWNAAAEAMQSVIDANVSLTEHGTWYCLHCGRYNDQGHTDGCYVGKCHTAKARMEGLHDRPDVV